MENRPILKDQESRFAAERIVTRLMKRELPREAECPENFDLQNHRLAAILTNVRKISDQTTAELMKGIRHSSELETLSVSERRKVTDYFWWLEYYQSIYNQNGQWYINEIRQGGAASSSPHTKRYNEPNNSLRRIFIHTHPADSTFSSPDIFQFFLGLDPDKILGFEAPVIYAGLSLQFVITDQHTYMCFPTADTEVPEYAESLGSGLMSSEYMEELLPAEFSKTWRQLITYYGYARLGKFIGQKLYSFRTLFPEEVNDLGVDLINLAHTLGICQRYSLPLYVADKGSYTFRKINSVEDVYPMI